MGLFTEEAYELLLKRFNLSTGHNQDRVETLIRLTNVAILAASGEDQDLIERYVAAYFTGGATNFARVVAGRVPCCLDHKLLAITDFLPGLSDLIVAAAQEALVNVDRMKREREGNPPPMSH